MLYFPQAHPILPPAAWRRFAKFALGYGLLPFLLNPLWGQDVGNDKNPPARSQEVSLSTPLAWLQEQDDYPLVSRRLMVLEPGCRQPRILLQPLLYCFDAADHQAVRWAGNRLLVNGPQAESRPSPNIAMPVQWVDLQSGRVGRLPGYPTGFEATQQGDRWLAWQLTSFTVRPLDSADSKPLLAWTETQLQRSQIKSAHWSWDEKNVLVHVRVVRNGLRGGLWQVPFQGSAKHLGVLPGSILQVLPSGLLLVAQRTSPKTYSPRRLLRLRAQEEKADVELLANDLSWQETAGFRPQKQQVAFVRYSDGSLVLREIRQESDPIDRLLWKSEKRVTELAWSPDGRWLAFTDVDGSHQHWLRLIELPTLKVHTLGFGKRPAFAAETGKINRRVKDTDG